MKITFKSIVEFYNARRQIITFMVTLMILEISLGDLNTEICRAKIIRHSLWNGFTQSSGVFTIGKVANSNAGFVRSYQGYMDSTL
ncbi:4254_t:CDS:2, partial [Funneliformis caledonium]